MNVTVSSPLCHLDLIFRCLSVCLTTIERAASFKLEFVRNPRQQILTDSTFETEQVLQSFTDIEVTRKCDSFATSFHQNSTLGRLYTLIDRLFLSFKQPVLVIPEQTNIFLDFPLTGINSITRFSLCISFETFLSITFHREMFIKKSWNIFMLTAVEKNSFV